jgi:Carbohydrate family 9 binding domain-like
MKGYVTAFGLTLLLGAAGVASATTVTLDFNDTKNSTANTQVLSSAPMGAVKNVNVGGRNAVQTGGTSDNEFLYVALPKGAFSSTKPLWAVIEYYDQGTDTFQFHYDAAGTDTTVGEGAVTKHDTKAWATHVYSLPGADLQEMGPGGADIWIDDIADGPETIDKITVTDEDPNLTHWPHVDTKNPIKIDGVITPGEWDDAYQVTVNTVAQDALAGVNWGGPNDFSGTYYYKWDESGLYVRGDVTDATPRLNDAGGAPPNYWNGDGLQIYLGLDWSDPTHSSYLDTDFDVYIGLGDTPMWAEEAGSTKMQVDWEAIPTGNLAIKNTDAPKGYQFELYVPWQKILDGVQNTTLKIAAGQKIGWFMFANNSLNINPSHQDVAMSPFKRTNPSSTPSSWSTVVLEPAAATPPATPPTAGP